ncbi:MAG: hypothetical protein QOH04_2614 [Sphingomonadales bacterium]|jgi:hypothetical protein|nr:hypothetical protein [Sphingomonadales bacterium]
MTLKPLDFDFAMMGPLSRRPPYAVPAEEMLAEIDAEIADRAALYPRLVAKGTLGEAAAEAHIAGLAAIAEDLRERAFYLDPAWREGTHYRRASPDRPFAAKVRELRREITIRRHAWPARIAKPGDPLGADAAARRMERLEAVHFLYWVWLFKADDEVAALAGDEAALAIACRAWTWRRDEWMRTAADAGDAAADPSWSTARAHARLEAQLAALPPDAAEAARSGVAAHAALFRQAAVEYGFLIEPARASLCSPARGEEVPP